MSHAIASQEHASPPPNLWASLLQCVLQAGEAQAAVISLRAGSYAETWSANLASVQPTTEYQQSQMLSGGIQAGAPIVSDSSLVATDFASSARFHAEEGGVVAEVRVFDGRKRRWSAAQSAGLQSLAKHAAALRASYPTLSSTTEARVPQGSDHRSDELYRAMFEDSPRPLIVYDPQSLRVLAVNRAAATLYGYEPAEFRRIKLPTLWPSGAGADASQIQEEVDAFVRSLPLQRPAALFRRTHVRKDCTPLDVELSSTAITHDDLPARLLHVLDLTKKMQVQRLAAQASRAQRMLSACNEALIRAPSEEELLRRVCQLAVEIGGYLLAWIGFAQDDVAKTVRPAAVAGRNGHLLLAGKLSWDGETASGQNSAGRAIRSGKPDVTFDVTKDASFEYWKPYVEAIGYRGIVALPLRHKNKVLGSMCFYSSAVAQVGASELALLEALADDVAFGIENLRLLDGQRRLHDAVLSVGSAVSHRMGDDFFEYLVRGLVEAVGAQAGQVAGLVPGVVQTGRTRYAVVDGQSLRLHDFVLEEVPRARMQSDEVWISNGGELEHYPDSYLLSHVGAAACAVHRLDDAHGEPIGFLSVLFRSPVTQTKLVEALLRIFAARASSELQRLKYDARIRSQASLLDKAQDAIYVRDLTHRILTWNQGCERIFGWTADEVVGKSAAELQWGDQSLIAANHEALLTEGAWAGEAVHRRKDGDFVQVETRWTLVRDEQGRPESVLSISTDITRRKEAEEAVHKLAFFDALTGLPNRQSFNAALRVTRSEAARSGNAGALLFVNLDKFKLVNETLGHSKGDLLLKLASARLKLAVASAGSVAHIGADEFFVLLSPVHPTVEAAQTHAGEVAQQIAQAFKEPFRLQEFVHMASVCVGIASFAADAHNDEELLQHADLALVQAKSVGRGVVRFYDPRLYTAESPRFLRRLNTLRGLSHEQVEQVLTRGA